MKAACVILSVLILLAIMAVCVMVKFATEINIQERKRDYLYGNGVYRLTKTVGVIHLESENSSFVNHDRFPFVAAIIKNSSTTWSFQCFASIIMMKWLVTAAHCQKPGGTYKALLYSDFSRNSTHTYPILYWKNHENYTSDPHLKSPKYDIAVAKLGTEFYPLTIKPSYFDGKAVKTMEMSVWKTVSTMDQKIFLTNEFGKYSVSIAPKTKCARFYGVKLDDSTICVDLSRYDDCFVHEFGPIYSGDKIAGVLALKPVGCHVKFAVFTNVSYFANWIRKTVHSVPP